MNKTLSIGLAGFSFIIEEHAYIKLSDYLAALRSSLDTNEAEEVMHDIEIRMVEIFKDALGKREVINDSDVEKVISQIGKPEQIEEQEEAYFSEATSNKTKNTKTTSGYNGQKQLFRDPERQKIAGVCAGLAYYTGLDITAMRAIWVGLFLILFPIPGNPLLMVFLYIILWIVLPKAQTASDFLKMKGKPMNFDNLKEESNKIVQFANESTQRVGELYNENKPYINNAGNRLWNLVRYILGGIFSLLALGCLIGSAVIFGTSWGIGNQAINLPRIARVFLGDSEVRFFGLAFAFLTVFIPAVIFFFLAIKLFSPKTKLNYTGYIIGGLIFLWVAFLAVTGFTIAKNKTQFSGENDETENVAINTTSDSILIDVKKVAISSNFKSYWNNNYTNGITVYEEDYPNVDVKREDIKTPYLTLKKRADGYNLPLNMKIPVEVQGNKILLPNYISYPYDYRFRHYVVDYELVVPKSMKVISLNDGNGFSVNDEDKADEDEDKTDSLNVNSANNIVINSANKDSVIVNGKKVSEAEAERMLKEADKKDFKDISISINNGKKEITIKTK